MTPQVPRRRRVLALAVAAVPLWAASGCAMMPGVEPPRVNVVGLEKLPGEGMELRFGVKLRVQNPNASAIEYDGLSVELDLNGRALASGVSADKGTVPRFGETVITVPVSVSAVAAMRQLLAFADGTARAELPYAVRGRLGGGVFGSVRFASEGSLKLPQ